MFAFALKYLLTLTFVGVIWTVSGEMSVGEKSFGEMSVGKTPVGDMSVGEKSVGEKSVGEMSVGETPVGDMSVGETPVGEKSVGEMSVGETPVGEKSVGKTPVGEKSVGGKSVGEKSVGEISVGGKSVGGKSVGGKSVGGKSVGEKSVGKKSVGDKSVSEKSVGEKSVGGKSVGQSSVNSSASSVNKTKARARRPKRAAGKAVPTTQAMRKEWLQTHNDVRRDMTGYLHHQQPKAAGMMRMYWNAYLEATATAWSVRCCDDWKHGQSGIVEQEVFKKPMKRYGDFIGQNIQYFTGPRMSPKAITTLYADETTEFDFNTLACKSLCGHYTAIVWNSTFLVGCGYAKCDGKFGITSTCNYLPGGNNGNQPYAAGPPCTSCNGFAAKIANVPKCEDDLCQPEDKCSLVKECKVTDTDNCLCDEAVYDDMVKRLLAGTGVIHTGPPVIVYGLLLPLVAILLGQRVQLG